MDDNEKRELKNLIEREVLTPLGMGYAPDDKKYPNFRVSKVMGPQWPDYEYLEWPHYSVTMQVVARPKPHLSLVKENKKMKISKARLKQLITEEINGMMEDFVQRFFVDQEGMGMEDFDAALESFEVKFGLDFPDSVFTLHDILLNLDEGLANKLKEMYAEDFEARQMEGEY